MFVAVCAYLVSQTFVIPLTAAGPSWAVWPSLPDCAIVAMIATAFAARRRQPAFSPAGRWLLCALITAVLAMVVSYVLLIRIYPDPRVGRVASVWGLFQLYRLFQFTAVFYVASLVPLSARRLAILETMVVFVAFVVSIMVVLTYFDIVPKSLLTSHLPGHKGIAGPWASFGKSSEGLGTIGYNHGYVGAQVMMCTALALHLMTSRTRKWESALLGLAFVSCLLSGSRASLIGLVVFAVAYLSRKPRTLAIISLVLVIGLGALPPRYVRVLGNAMDRQSTISSSYQEDGLSGRTDIWQQRFNYLNRDPIKWVIGSGPGSQPGLGGNAHMLLLQFLTETGMIGLLMYLWMTYHGLRWIWRYEQGDRPMFWMTIAFLVTSLTQETFYPTTAFGHFIGFYLFSLAVCLRLSEPQRPAFGSYAHP